MDENWKQRIWHLDVGNNQKSVQAYTRAASSSIFGEQFSSVWKSETLPLHVVRVLMLRVIFELFFLIFQRSVEQLVRKLLQLRNN